MSVKVEADGITQRRIAEADEEGKRLFLRYEIGISGRSSTPSPWEMLYAFIAGMTPIAGEVKRRKSKSIVDREPDVTMWFISRVPVLPQELMDWMKESGCHYSVKLDSWGWAPAGLQGISEEDLLILEGAFNSNLVMKEFLADEEKDEEV